MHKTPWIECAGTLGQPQWKCLTVTWTWSGGIRSRAQLGLSLRFFEYIVLNLKWCVYLRIYNVGVWLCVSLWELWELGREGAKKYILPWGIVNNEVWGTFCAAPILVSSPKCFERVEYLSMATEVPWVGVSEGPHWTWYDMMLRIAAHLVAWRLSQDHESLRPSTNHHWLSRMIIDHHGSLLIVTNHHSLQLITSRHDRFGDAHAAMRRQRHNGVGRVAVRVKNHGGLGPCTLVNTENVHPKGLCLTHPHVPW